MKLTPLKPTSKEPTYKRKISKEPRNPRSRFTKKPKPKTKNPRSRPTKEKSRPMKLKFESTYKKENPKSESNSNHFEMKNEKFPSPGRNRNEATYKKKPKLKPNRSDLQKEIQR